MQTPSIVVSGFTGENITSPPRQQRHRVAPRRVRSLLSQSLLSMASSECTMSRAMSTDSMEGSELPSSSWGTSSSPAGEQEQSSPPACGVDVAAEPCAASGANAVEIPYTRAARARIDRAEAQGRRRDEQLEMLHAVRQYMAQTKAQAKALQAQC